MTKNKKLLISLMRAFLGDLGVDSFIMKKYTEGALRIVWCIVLFAVFGVLLGMFIANGAVGMLIATIVVAVLIVVRKLMYFIGGLLMLKSPEEDILETYK